jgi:DNA-directed DNA polymerase III PolC
VGDSFTHLHLHTEFSMLDGAARIDQVVAAAVADGQPAIGITDHGNMYGVLDFYKECRKQGINPVIGTEAYMAKDSRHERPVIRGRVDDTGGDGDGGNKAYYHLILLAESTAGYHNLMKLSSEAYLEGYWRKPRLDWDMLEAHHEGIIATTGCLGGVVLQALLNGQEQRATELAARLQDIFGRDNLFVELQDHGLPEQRRTNPKLIEIAKRIKAPLLATNDSHYTSREDHVAHDALLCVQTGSLMDDPNRFKFTGDEHYLKSAAEMRAAFAGWESACDNTLWIAERAKVEIDFGNPQLPNFPLPPGFDTQGSYLRHLTFEGARERYGSVLPAEVTERLEYELGVIEQMGFSAYFLVVWDLIKYAKDRGIRVGPGRGSAAGCCVAYCLRIVDLDPIRYDLLFERFLNPGRKQMPDIDMDFDERYRGEMIKYAADRYGFDHVAQIVTFSTIKARAAVRDAARVLGYPYAVGDKVAKAMPPLVMGRDTPLYACFEQHPKFTDGYKAAQELRDMYATDPDVKKVVDVAKGLEGLRRQDGIHAAAVVITKDPLTEYLPIQRKPGPGEKPEDAPIVTQYEMHGVEELGLLKMDFLGLRNLSVIERALDLVEEQTGERPDIDNIPLDDEPTLELLRRGDSMGVFQLEGGPMRALMRSLAPTSFDDVAALVALYRPGPMAANMHNDYADRKNGRKPIDYLHPDLADILGDTQGLMIYQESMMRVAQKFAGYTLEEADNLRKACLPAGSRMLTRTRGYVPIERVMSLSDRRVQTIDVTSSTSRFEEVEDVWSVGVKPVYRLTTSSGYTIEATDNHPFLVEDEWRELKDVRPGDLVGVAARTTTHGGAKVTSAEVDLAALLLSEGYTPDLRDPTLHRTGHFCNTDPDLVAAFRDAFEAFFGYPHDRTQKAGTVTQLRLKKAELLALEEVLGGFALSAGKRIPMRYLNAPTASVVRFLALYFCADGWADRSGIHFGSKSEAICRDLKRMLLRIGVVGRLGHREHGVHGTHWRVSVTDKGQARRFIRAVRPHLTPMKMAKVRPHLMWRPEGSGSATDTGIPSSFLRRELERRPQVTGESRRALGVDSGTLDGLLLSERLHDLATGDLVWDSVVSVEFVGEKECFDFRMSNPERPYALVEDVLVHNCGKKIRELLAKERVKFVEGCERTGYGKEIGTKLFDIIEPFADYAFNKSHSYGYGFVSYQTAWLKAHHPVAYLAALLTSVKDDKDATAKYLAECRAMGIPVLVPDVNVSHANFTVKDDSISFGMSAIRNVGTALVNLIVEEREANGPFRDFFDFCDRVDMTVLNKRTIESLIKGGGFDSLGHSRKGLCLVHEQIIDRTIQRRKKEAEGQFDLFSLGDDDSGATKPADMDRIPIPEGEFEKMQRLGFEKEMLGLYVSDHPLMGVEASLRKLTDCTINEVRDGAEGEMKTVGGVVTSLVRKYTKKGDLMATFVLEDLEAAIEAFVFPRTHLEYGSLLRDDAVVCVKGRLDKREEPAKLIVMEVRAVDLNPDFGPPVHFELPLATLTDTTVDSLKALLLDHPGDSPVYLHVGETVLKLPDEFCVDAANGLRAEVRVLLGPNAVLG